MKKILFFIAITLVGANFLFAQHLFSVNYNNLSNEKVTQLKTQVVNAEKATLSLTKNNENKNVFSVRLASVNETKIIILNEQTGKHVVLTPEEETRPEFQLAPFFIEELMLGALGYADQYAVIESSFDFSVKNVSFVSLSKNDAYIPQFFYGKKESVKEALPNDRQIIHILKQKPRYIPARPDDPENLKYIAQLEEQMSYYIYVYQLPEGNLCTYDEHFNPDKEKSGTKVGENLQFVLTGINMNATQQIATEYALELWGEKVAGLIPVDIEVKFTNMGGGVIGASYRMPNFLNTGQVPERPTDTYYVSPLWNQMVGYDATGQRDIKLEMNSQFNFYYDITGNPSSSQIDWITTMLHEVAHGLGFYPLVGQNGAYTLTPQYPGIFDRQLFQGVSGSCITELTQTERAALVISNNLYAGAPGSFLLSANSGTRVQIYAPGSYSSGSSNSHWNSNVSFSTFMKYYIDNGWKLHTIGTRKMGILKDIGWTEPNIYPNGVWVSYHNNGGTGAMADQQFLPGSPQKLSKNNFAKTGYVFSHWNTTANNSGTTYQDQQNITISADMSLYAQWTPNTYTLTFNPGNDGTVYPTLKSVTYDAAVGTLPIPQRPGYEFVEWRYGATVISETTVWTYTANITVTANWKTPSSYTITATATSGGSISPAGTTTVLGGESKEYTITANTNYKISDVLVDNVSVGAVSSYEFINITSSHTIHAIFETTAIYTITATASAGGTILPEGITNVAQGSNATFTITPDEDYIILDVLVDNISIGAVNEHTFSNVTAAHTIHAEFKLISGISENQNNTYLQIIPNPASHSFELRIANYELRVDNMEIYDALGRKVSSHYLTPTSSNHKIDISHLQAGAYLVKVGELTAKLIVN